MQDVKMVIVVRKDLNMRKGKLAAQVAHASMQFLLSNNESQRNDEMHVKLSPDEAQWMSEGFTKVVCSVDSEEELRDLIMHAQLNGLECNSITDAGRTEFKGVPTLTCAAFGPSKADAVNEVTGKLKLI